jgi:hypothetical protein
MLAVIDDALVSDDLRERINATVLCAAYAFGKPQQRISAQVDHHESRVKLYLPENGRERTYPPQRDMPPPIIDSLGNELPDQD